MIRKRNTTKNYLILIENHAIRISTLIPISFVCLVCVCVCVRRFRSICSHFSLSAALCVVFDTFFLLPVSESERVCLANRAFLNAYRIDFCLFLQVRQQIPCTATPLVYVTIPRNLIWFVINTIQCSKTHIHNHATYHSIEREKNCFMRIHKTRWQSLVIRINIVCDILIVVLTGFPGVERVRYYSRARWWSTPIFLYSAYRIMVSQKEFNTIADICQYFSMTRVFSGRLPDPYVRI